MTVNLITGVAGFVGSHLAEALLEKGQQVIGIDEFNDYYDPRLKRQNISGFQHHSAFQLIEANLLDLDCADLLKNVDVVYHQAAQAGVRASWGTTFNLYTDRNINTTQVLLEAAKESSQLQRFVFASSSSVYGNAETLPTSEAICPQPVSPYGITKLAAERLCLLYHQNFGVPTVGLRYFTVYGPRQRPDMAFNRFFQCVLQQQPIDIYGDGKQTRDFTFVSDAIAANLAAAEAKDVAGEVFNIGGGSRVSMAETIDAIEQIVGQPIVRNYRENAKGDARHTAADVSKAQRLLDYKPQVSIRDGLQKEWEWIRQGSGSL
jgi:nucleoside-diphosphate-sugar epimerase